LADVPKQLSKLFSSKYDKIQELQDAIKIYLPQTINYESDEWETEQKQLDELKVKAEALIGMPVEFRFYLRGDKPLGSSNSRGVKYINVVPTRPFEKLI